MHESEVARIVSSLVAFMTQLVAAETDSSLRC